ncbi:hypothetical protein G9A89_023370 [Geosiphon pyriformis]|nr:hypothetical protein G9A89_023370 [Geosiphon pyriformis]
MGKRRVRFNEKARSNPKKNEGQVQKNHAVEGGLQRSISEDTNALVIEGSTKVERQKEKKERLMKEEQNVSTKKMSSKKRKRLEAYIQKKLKKEERVIMLEKLSNSSFSSNLMKSSRALGQGQETLRERLRKALYEKRTGLKQSDPAVPLFVDQNDGDEISEVEDEKANIEEKQPAINEKLQNSMQMQPSLSAPAEVVTGGALKRGPDGELVMPIKKKKQKKIRRVQMIRNEKDDDSFDSSDSQYDSDKQTKISSDQEMGIAEEEKSSLAEDDQDNKSKMDKNSFKEWALDQIEIKINEVQPSNSINLEPTQNNSLKIPVTIRDGIDITGDEYLDILKPVYAKKAFYVPVKRKPEIQASRLALPICREEQVIMEAIGENPVVVICGETGSGKTTQVPQFLYEAGYGDSQSDNPGIIGVTQPRRVAAVSMSKRVAQELSLSEKEVSYQIRYDATTSSKTVIKFMTDGVLLRELAGDFLLSRYSAIIIDEAHERSLNTDILIGVVSRVFRLRNELNVEERGKIKPLKVIIMSATLRVSDFTQNKTLFKIPPPIINVDARQYPVSIHFNKRTPKTDYVTEAFKKVCKIHAGLPHGGILVFLTGQNEIMTLCKKLRKRFPKISGKNRHETSFVNDEDQTITEAFKRSKDNLAADAIEIEDLTIGDNPNENNAFDPDSDSDLEENGEGFENEEILVNEAPLHILPLYSLLSTQAQMKVFEPPPPGTRLCVIATNVAETSLTIPGVKYVVDCGKVKERHYDVRTGVQSYTINWISKASADQRAGRAGRTSPGHCYRLYSSAVFNDQFENHTTPEIHRMPIEGVVLQMKAMNIDIVVNFPFPTPPDRDQLLKAEKLLRYLGALDEDGCITDLGRTMSTLPISPRFAKILVIGAQHGCLPYVILIVSALSVGDPFVKEYHLEHEEDLEKDIDLDQDLNEEKKLKKQEFSEIQKTDVNEKEKRKYNKREFYKVQKIHSGFNPSSDILKLLNVVGAYEYAGGTDTFCDKNFLRPKAMQEILKLKGQLTTLLQNIFPELKISLDPKIKPPSSSQLTAIRQIITAGFTDQIAVRKGLVEKAANLPSSFKTTRGVAYVTMWSDEDAFIHPSSVLFHGKPPNFLAYQELQRTTKLYMKGLTVIEPNWLPKLSKSLCTFSKPSNLPKASSTLKNKRETEIEAFIVPSFGPKSWKLPPVKENIANLAHQ